MCIWMKYIEFFSKTLVLANYKYTPSTIIKTSLTKKLTLYTVNQQTIAQFSLLWTQLPPWGDPLSSDTVVDKESLVVRCSCNAACWFIGYGNGSFISTFLLTYLSPCGVIGVASGIVLLSGVYVIIRFEQKPPAQWIKDSKSFTYCFPVENKELLWVEINLHS